MANEDELYSGKFQEVWVSPPYGDTFTHDSGRVQARTRRVVIAKGEDGFWRYADLSAADDHDSRIALVCSIKTIRKMKTPEGEKLDLRPTEECISNFKAAYKHQIPEGEWVNTTDIVNAVTIPGSYPTTSTALMAELNKIKFDKAA